MADGNIVLTIDAETGEAQKRVDRLEGKVQDLTNSITELGGKVDASFQRMEASVKSVGDEVSGVGGQISSEFETVNNKIDSVSETLDGVANDFSALGDTALTQFEGLGTGITDTIDSVKGFTGAFKGLNTVVAMSGVGLLITLLASLISYFKNTEAGATMLKKGMAGLSAIVGVVTNYFASLGEFIVNAFTNPQEALDTLRDKFQGLGDFLKAFPALYLNALQFYFLTLKETILSVAAATAEFFGSEATALNAQLEETRQKLEDVKKEAVENAKTIKDGVTDALGAVKDGLEGVADAASSAVAESMRAVDLAEEVRLATMANLKADAALNKQLADRQAIIDNERLSYAQRNKALQEAIEIQKTLDVGAIAALAAEEELLRLRMSTENDLETRRELEMELAEKIAERIEAEQTQSENAADARRELTDMAIDEARRVREVDEMLADSKERAMARTVDAQEQADLLALESMLKRDMATMVEIQATEEQKNELLENYEKQRLKISNEYALERAAEQQDIEQMITDAQGQVFSDRLSITQEQELLELEMQRQSEMRSLEEMGATEEQKARMRAGFDQQAIDMAEQHADQRLLREQELADSMAEVRRQGEELGIAMMSDAFGRRQKAEAEFAAEQRLEELDMAELQSMQDLEMMEATEEQKLEMARYYADLRLDIERDSAGKIKDIQRVQAGQQFDMFASAGDEILSMLSERNEDMEADTEASARRQFEKNKKYQKASAIIAGAQGVVQQLAVPQDALTGANFVKAAMVAATTAFSVSEIEKQKFDSSSFTADDGLGSADGSSITPIDLSFLQRDAESTEPLRAYVVNQEVQNAAMQQTLIENKVNLS